MGCESRIGDEQVAATADSLRFLAKPDGMHNLSCKANNELNTLYAKELVAAKPGIGPCMDDRTFSVASSLADPNYMATQYPKVGFAGGAAGIATLFGLVSPQLRELNGEQLVRESLKMTAELYKRMHFGPIDFHIDDNHGSFSEADVVLRKKGCGFLGVQGEVNSIMGMVFPQNTRTQYLVDGDLYILMARGMRDRGKPVNILVHNGVHAPSACLVLNLREGMTLDRFDLLRNYIPAYEGDIGVVTEEFTKCINAIAFANTDPSTTYSQPNNDLLQRMSATMHLATASLLGAWNGKWGEEGNLAVINH